MKQHKWHKEIKAWADGEEIEGRKKGYLTNKFYVLSNPNWNSNHWEFRIKPQTKEKDWVMICKKCGDELGIVYEPEDEIGDAEIKQMLNDIEYYQKRVEELEEQCEQLKTTIAKFRKIEDEYAHRKPLGGVEILDLFTELFGVKGTVAYGYMNPLIFAKAIEKAHGIGEQ